MAGGDEKNTTQFLLRVDMSKESPSGTFRHFVLGYSFDTYKVLDIEKDV
jgi:hypothetical protein